MSPWSREGAASSRREYIARINRVLDYIEQHLSETLTVKTLAEVASFSPYHFSRIFRALVGESLYAFLRRVRLEKAADKLCHTGGDSVTQIAFDAGFASPAAFSKAFRQQHGMSPSEWRDTHARNSRNGQTMRRIGEAGGSALDYLEADQLQQRWRISMSKLTADVQVRELPAMEVAYIRHVGPYAGDGALFGRLIGRLCEWAGPRGLLKEDGSILCVYHDNPEVTEEEKLRLSVCIEVPAGTLADGDIGRMSLPGGLYVVGKFSLREDQFAEAWQMIMGEWLPESGYQPDDRPCFEMYHNDPDQHPEGLFEVEICEPVKPL